MAGESHTTTDKRRSAPGWRSAAAARARVKGTGSEDDAGLRIDYPGRGEDDNLEEIDWDAFFDAFEEDNPRLTECPRQESNLCTRFRKPLLYPLSYGGRTWRLAGYSAFSPVAEALV